MPDNAAKRAWVEAANLLGRNPDAKVRCPVCGNDFITVRDVDVENEPIFDRYLRCNSCGTISVISRMRRPQ